MPQIKRQVVHSRVLVLGCWLLLRLQSICCSVQRTQVGFQFNLRSPHTMSKMSLLQSDNILSTYFAKGSLLDYRRFPQSSFLVFFQRSQSYLWIKNSKWFYSIGFIYIIWKPTPRSAPQSYVKKQKKKLLKYKKIRYNSSYIKNLTIFLAKCPLLICYELFREWIVS